jgi:hypothetical protein
MMQQRTAGIGARPSPPDVLATVSYLISLRTLLAGDAAGSRCPRPWENASEVWVDAPCFPGVRADADRQTDASSLSEAIRF